MGFDLPRAPDVEQKIPIPVGDAGLQTMAGIHIAVQRFGIDLPVVEIRQVVAHREFASGGQAGLAPGGELAMCHYLPDFDDRQVDTETLHGYVNACHGLQPSVAYRDRDFLLDIWRAG